MWINYTRHCCKHGAKFSQHMTDVHIAECSTLNCVIFVPAISEIFCSDVKMKDNMRVLRKENMKKVYWRLLHIIPSAKKLPYRDGISISRCAQSISFLICAAVFFFKQAFSYYLRQKLLQIMRIIKIIAFLPFLILNAIRVSNFLYVCELINQSCHPSDSFVLCFDLTIISRQIRFLIILRKILKHVALF